MALVLLHFFLRKKLGFFDLDAEGNLASLYSGVKLWIGATAALLLAALFYQLKKPRWESALWLCLASGLAYIGVDDMMAIHERLGFVLNNIFGLGGFYGESFNWLIYFTPAAILGLATLGAVLRHLWQNEKVSAYWFLAGVILWLGGIGVEWLGRYLLLQLKINVPLYYFLIVAEEGLEMFGASCLIFAILIYGRKLFKKHIQIKL